MGLNLNQIAILSRFDSLQFIKNSGKLIFERFIHFGVALYNNVSAETTAVAIFLFGKSRHCNCLVNMLVFFGRDTEAKEYGGMLYDYKPTDRLFPTQKSFLTREMVRGCKLSGVKKIRIHDLRHSHASLLIELGFAPLLISERLGHKNAETTLNTYSHLYPNKHGEVAEILSNLMRN